MSQALLDAIVQCGPNIRHWPEKRTALHTRISAWLRNPSTQELTQNDDYGVWLLTVSYSFTPQKNESEPGGSLYIFT